MESDEQESVTTHFTIEVSEEGVMFAMFDSTDDMQILTLEADSATLLGQELIKGAKKWRKKHGGEK